MRCPKPTSVFLLFTGLCLQLAATPAGAWGDYGHEVVGRIAEKILEKDAKTRQALQDILGVEPLALAAVWPDHVRFDDRFDLFSDYHFKDEAAGPDGHHDYDATVVLKKYPGILTSTAATREEKMIALRYLIHVVGDVQQPLHAGTKQDFGGNSCKVFWKVEAPLPPSCQGLAAEKLKTLEFPVKVAVRPATPYSPPSAALTTNVHELWDEHLVDYLREWVRRDQFCKTEKATPGKMKAPAKQFTYAEFADELLLRHPTELDPSSVNLDTDAWLSESREYRIKVGYPDQLPFEQRLYCGKKPDPTKDIPSLTLPFLESALPDAAGLNRRELVEKRLILGGVRLAALLKSIFEKTPTSTGPTEATILEKVHLNNL